MSLSPRRRSGLLVVVLGLAGLLTVSPSATAATAATADACVDGVTVVVDFTDVGGDVELGCADGDPASGREALVAAGFTPTDSIPGMICAIDARPDPCPEEFDGSFWAYWAGNDGEWTSHLEGADGVDPAPGDIEGWRYNDGATGPGISPTEAAAGSADAADGATADGGAEPPADEAGTDTTQDADDADEPAAADEPAGTEDPDGSGTAWIWFTVAGIAVVAAAVALLVRRRQR